MKKSLLNILKSTVPIWLLFGCTHPPMGGSMGGWDHMMGYGGYGGTLMWLILIFFIVVIVYLAVERNKKGGNDVRSKEESPMEVLKKRYAKGEITKEEFDAIKRDIEG